MRSEEYISKTILRIDRAASSGFGNPSFWITFTDGERSRTKANAGFVYMVGNPDLREGCSVEVNYTPSGRIRHMRPSGDQS